MKRYIGYLNIAAAALVLSAPPAASKAGSGLPPHEPVLTGPADGAVAVGLPPLLEVSVSDPESDTLTVTFFGRRVAADGDGPFSIIVIPDTQHYTAGLYGGAAWMFEEQVRWIVDHAGDLGVALVVHVGDVVQNGDAGFSEWQNSWAALEMLEDAGIPYTVSVGDNDQTPEGDADGSTALYNSFYGPDHFEGMPWYGGHYGSGGENHFVLFSAGGLDLISISLEYDQSPDAGVLAWADSLLKAYPGRRGIVCSHYILGTGNPAGFGWQGQSIYLGLYDNPNLFLMLSGHIPGEGRRSVDLGGRWLHALMADYQSRPNGGDGWLRIITFHPSSGQMHVRTYSPVLDMYEADSDSSSRFTLPVDLEPVVEWQVAGTAEGILSGATASAPWYGLEPGADYEWYAEADDGGSSTVSERWSFTAGEEGHVPVSRLYFALASGNPVRGEASFAVELPCPSHVRLTVFDAMGRRLDVVASGDYQEGRHEIFWDTSIPGGRTSPGVYFARLEACGTALVRKVVILR